MTATISEIARLADVSEHTVARVVAHSPLVSEDIHTRVNRAIAQTGYAPPRGNRMPTTRRNPILAIVHAGMSSALLDDIHAAARDAAEPLALATCVRSLGEDVRKWQKLFGEFLETLRPAAIVLMPPLADCDQLAGLAWEHGCRCVRLSDTPLSEPEPDWLVLPWEQLAEQAVRALADQGHERIGLITSAAMPHCEPGYELAMAALGLDQGVSLSVCCEEGVLAAHEAAEMMLDFCPAPTAVIACSDTIAAALHIAARHRGLPVPDRLSIIGCSISRVGAQFSPPLPGVQMPLAQTLGSILAEPPGNDEARWTIDILPVDDGASQPRRD